MVSFLLKFLDLLKAYTQDYLANDKVNELAHRESLQVLVPDNLKANSFEASAKNVLVVGLTKTISKQIAVVFDKLSCKVAYATSGYQALGRLLNEHFDVVISNVQMDPIDGITLASIIKLQKKRMPVQVILLSDDAIHFPFVDLKPDVILKKSEDLGAELNRIFSIHKDLVSEEKPKGGKVLQRILYVDDDKDVLTLARHSLKKDASLIVSFLSDASKIHEKIQEFEPDLLISDIKMPGFDAVEFLKQLKETEATKDLQVLFVSADTESVEAKSLLNAGALGVLHKQNMSKDFARAVRKFWEQ